MVAPSIHTLSNHTFTSSGDLSTSKYVSAWVIHQTGMSLSNEGNSIFFTDILYFDIVSLRTDDDDVFLGSRRTLWILLRRFDKTEQTLVMTFLPTSWFKLQTILPSKQLNPLTDPFDQTFFLSRLNFTGSSLSNMVGHTNDKACEMNNGNCDFIDETRMRKDLTKWEKLENAKKDKPELMKVIL